jgi:hypothetical protein
VWGMRPHISSLDFSPRAGWGLFVSILLITGSAPTRRIQPTGRDLPHTHIGPGAHGATTHRRGGGAALAALAEVSLAKHAPFEDSTPAVMVHRLVQVVARARSKASGAPHCTADGDLSPDGPSRSAVAAAGRTEEAKALRERYGITARGQ